ncbi:unnamed protein product [Lampetra fluviatilis]
MRLLPYTFKKAPFTRTLRAAAAAASLCRSRDAAVVVRSPTAASERPSPATSQSVPLSGRSATPRPSAFCSGNGRDVSPEALPAATPPRGARRVALSQQVGRMFVEGDQRGWDDGGQEKRKFRMWEGIKKGSRESAPGHRAHASSLHFTVDSL